MSEAEGSRESLSWDEDALVAKAQRYAEVMLEADRDDWRFALWSSLALEFILRTALANFNPALLADTRDWNNLLSALGYEPTAKKFIPKSISVKEVIDRLAAILPEFDSELAGFSARHTARRNSELHSGATAFDGVKQSTWLPLYYKTCKALLASTDRELEIVFGSEEAATAEKLIAALADDAAKTVKATIHAHATVWAKKDAPDREKLTTQATLWATRHLGHRVKCPACTSDSIVFGDPISAPTKAIKDDLITEKQQHLPSKFECIACGMKIAGLSQLSAAGLGDVYTQTFSYDAGEYYAPPNDDEMHNYEPDNNEPY
ncbi:hypothetical protein SAMN03159423_5010 [Bradyrhizobium sp. NFR13]|uniref:hypothetical protein n=1 Tax=Bradyrhizobium sp. NFR13 TaxID=1566285 RepID=UPI0008E56C73|nr:hypothetical protein [Bradyrhizobium sp. NFR13]SFM04119.1 hypothetical protein SAMN03159423_5010 [Bradyrhizobium sp. NFR13]